MKEYLFEHGIPMTPFLPGHAPLDAGEIVARLGLPLVAKLRSRSGGRGLEIIRDVAALAPVTRRRFILERFVDAPEVSVESFVSGGEIRFTSTTEYASKTRVNVVPARLDESTRASLLEINRHVIRALRISWGMTHAGAAPPAKYGVIPRQD
jgi:biotin carboxylase